MLVLALFQLLASSARASTTWYVNRVRGSDSNNCLAAKTACKTIGHAISLAASGDTIEVAAATYTENLTINVSLRITGASATTTIIDGGSVNTVVSIPNAGTNVTLAKVTIRNGSSYNGGGIVNNGTLTITNTTLSGNSATGVNGGGIVNLLKYLRLDAAGDSATSGERK